MATSRKVVRLGEFPALEKAVYEWFLSARAHNVSVTGFMIQAKARLFAEKSGIPEKHSFGQIE